MFTISLHKVRISAPVGLYPQELVLGNQFEVDIDVQSEKSSLEKGYFVDYTVLNDIIQNAFLSKETTLEIVVRKIHEAAFTAFPFILKVKVSLRKMTPPMQGNMAYAQVVYEA